MPTLQATKRTFSRLRSRAGHGTRRNSARRRQPRIELTVQEILADLNYPDTARQR
jgi:hypothetical protein